MYLIVVIHGDLHYDLKRVKVSEGSHTAAIAALRECRGFQGCLHHLSKALGERCTRTGNSIPLCIPLFQGRETDGHRITTLESWFLSLFQKTDKAQRAAIMYSTTRKLPPV